MKKLFLILMEILIIIVYVYVLCIDSIPKNIILFQNEKLNFHTLFGLTYEKQENQSDSIEASSNLATNLVGEKSTLLLKLFDKITLKTIDLDVISDVKVVPVGNVIGLKLYTKGVLVVGMNEVESKSNEKVKPYENTGIVEGDMIISVNNKAVTSTVDLLEEVNKSNGTNLQIEYLRDGNIYETDIKPEKIEENKYKLGLWVRDSAAGVGTITFYEPSTRQICRFRTWDYGC